MWSHSYTKVVSSNYLQHNFKPSLSSEKAHRFLATSPVLTLRLFPLLQQHKGASPGALNLSFDITELILIWEDSLISCTFVYFESQLRAPFESCLWLSFLCAVHSSWTQSVDLCSCYFSSGRWLLAAGVNLTPCWANVGWKNISQ